MAADDDVLGEHDLDTLRRVAFGRTSNAAEEHAALQALERLNEVETQSVAKGAGAEGPADSTAEGPADSTADATADGAAAAVDVASVHADEALPTRSRPRWIMPVVALALGAVGIAGGLAARASGVDIGIGSSAAPPSSTPTTHEYNRDIADPDLPELLYPVLTPGDLAAAELWFSEPQELTDIVTESFGAIDPATTRLAQVNHGADVWKIWVAKNFDGELCLLAGNEEPKSAACTGPSGFARDGLYAGFDGDDVVVRWNGSEITTTILKR
ncbi:hypothetical protein [Glaciibacter psychrotolerans]|uniref:Uncharacterized protein n=1 Tax=Glaciibacter psychrotolerans TaxID=670054 RepID=A0A7Z0J6C8_9MICO|nr:hypothetical protein [Leifsonia psychrotolerans]NYJ20091.1 hypothetical protein [Leifsonia psychrotolerans]